MQSLLPSTLQESFQAGYAAFEPSMPQYSSSALPGTGYVPAVTAAPSGALPEGNKYDPKPADKFGDQATGKVSWNGFDCHEWNNQVRKDACCAVQTL